MSFIGRDCGENITVLHYSGQDGNFSCCCECLRCVIAILNLCCRFFFQICCLKLQEHVSPSRRLCWRLFACYTSSGYFMCFLFLPLDCISLQATALTEARKHTRTHTDKNKTTTKQKARPRKPAQQFSKFPLRFKPRHSAG